MKKILTLATFIFLFGMAKIFASGNQDTLILLDGKIVTRTIDDKSLEVLNNLQANINTWYTLVDQEGRKPLKVQNKEIDFFVIGGVRYGNRHTMGGNHCVRILVEGEASIYTRSGTVTNHYTHTDNTTNPKFNITTTTSSTEDLEYSELFIKGKPMPYSFNIPYITKNFAKIFAKCPKLIEESKKEGFDFNDLVGIAKKYNACF